MTILRILEYPDIRLRVKSKPVDIINSSIKKLIYDMFETMYHQNGIGLAATQVNVNKSVIVIDIKKKDTAPMIFINPEFSLINEEINTYKEGCLSIPGLYENIKRYKKIKIKALDYFGHTFEYIVEGLLAVCIQHECDHLNGILFIDYLSKWKCKKLNIL